MLPMLALAFQLNLVSTPPRTVDDDSLRDVGRAHDAQAGFERGRRYLLPWSLGGGDRCDVRVGRYCWWSEGDDASQPPAEPDEIAHRRLELLAELDALGARHPGDAWIAGMRVYYRLENAQVEGSDSVARGCRATGWWCTALQASVAQARGDLAAADSGFGVALAAMPDSTRCAWRDITALLPGDVRDRYAHQSCGERAALEARYWMLAAPRLSATGNEWRSEFYARRVAATLLATAVTPHRIGWGGDAGELLLRYGLPVAWSRIQPSGIGADEPEILGHDPSPSFHFGPHAALLEGDAAAGEDGWSLSDVHGESRYAHRAIRRIATMTAQLARFRRGDSTLLVAAWATSDDSLASPAVWLGAVGSDGRPRAQRQDSVRVGRGSVMLRADDVGLPGIDASDSATGTLARVRTLAAPRHDSGSVALSDILLYRPGEQEAPALAQALALAIPGDTASVARPIGLYWEAYGADAPSADTTAAPPETAILVERIDHGFYRAARRRLGLADPDSPVRVRWSDSRPPTDGVAPHALALDLSTLPAGRYRITVGVSGAAGSATTRREVELREP